MIKVIFQTVVILLFLFSGCNSSNHDNRFELLPEPDKVLREEYEKLNEIREYITGQFEICDTCTTAIYVSHDECTDCTDVTVDSGIVYIPKRLVFKFDSLRRISNGKIKRLTADELYFEGPADFKKLWDDSVYSEVLEQWAPVWDKKYLLKGKVTDMKFRMLKNGIVEPFPKLYFTVITSTKVSVKEENK